ncbi:bifunctional diaminohydroxyphosphoribosylaminopyrimidine deaminase/5-amino-6-(5-phosphoribosylamino)uracil reductase RibD [Saccharicrinis fermentans]|uniref:Riboflavin biosynthesis protein RibD n=1 Tax=Saccharicrinis fermentans DSM 9555 = JCM 21142 TaxID=869213 RepID=W7YIW0_9BACT|nr:bifunctional diaminohydroxyphosphoribosylaminopyrimidine deaminase/5-amino-6-(5-phosphoribosylamino)uracil reductase RibD [Saccharicrinis fermentans]GAF02469.1 riboflavin biosynthesis protein RibD [Saccharicrinis fermentans DSM 9555 = JCM 21142]
MDTNMIYMQRCLQLAQNGLGNTYSNPMVGSVIVYDHKIIGEGFHHKAGQAHAEVNAIHSVKDKELLKKSTLYVNLEPCAHYGKTPPCSLLIKESGIPKVVVGCTDTFSEVAGKGIEMLRQAGVEVIVGVLEKESRELNKRFFTFHEKKRPYVILKWAQTLDGFIDIDRTVEHYGQPTWITNEIAKKLVHKWRSEEQAILVGTNTAVKDNPSLTTRQWPGNNPLRILIDRQGKVPNGHHILDGATDTIVFSAQKAGVHGKTKYVQIDFRQNIIPQILHVLYAHQLQSVIVEGGRQVLQSFIDGNLWDEARVFIGDVMFINGVEAPKLNVLPFHEEEVGNSRLQYMRNFSMQ